MEADQLTIGHTGSEHGVFHASELTSLGITRGERQQKLATEELTALRKDWFAVPGANQKVQDAVRTGGVLSCVSALQYYGFWVPPGYPEVHARRTRKCQGKHSSCRGFSPTTAGRTAVDSPVVALECAARCMSDEDWIAVCDSIQNSTPVSAEALRAAMGPLPKWVVELFNKTDGNSQSGTESVARVRLRASHYKVHVQPKIPDVGHTDLRIGKLIIECDGKQYHSSAEAYQTDRYRDRKATVGRYLHIRLTYDDVMYGWDEVDADIKSITTPDRHRERPKRRSKRKLDAADNPR